MTPSIAVVHVNGFHSPRVRLWLPLFLLWIPVILLSPLILLALIVACPIFGISLRYSIATFWALLRSLPGTDVRVAAEGNHVHVRIL